MIQAIFSFDLSILGEVTVVKYPNAFSSCVLAATWNVTLNEITEGSLLQFTFDTTFLEGEGAKVLGPNITQYPALLHGGFNIQLQNKRSKLIPYNANDTTMTTYLEGVGLSIHNIEITPSDKSEARSWIITFNAFEKFNSKKKK
jgi:hypothetical protein